MVRANRESITRIADACVYLLTGLARPKESSVALASPVTSSQKVRARGILVAGRDLAAVDRRTAAIDVKGIALKSVKTLAFETSLIASCRWRLINTRCVPGTAANIACINILTLPRLTAATETSFTSTCSSVLVVQSRGRVINTDGFGITHEVETSINVDTLAFDQLIARVTCTSSSFRYIAKALKISAEAVSHTGVIRACINLCESKMSGEISHIYRFPARRHWD